MDDVVTNGFYCYWRPVLGWIVTIGLGIQFVIAPSIVIVTTLCGHPVHIPTLDTGPLVSLVTGSLGLGGLRTIEKLSSVQNSH